MSGLIHTGLGSSSIIAHVLHSPPPPPANSFVIGPAVINTHTPAVLPDETTHLLAFPADKDTSEVVIPLNNFPGPADDTVTSQTYYRIQNTERDGLGVTYLPSSFQVSSDAVHSKAICRSTPSLVGNPSRHRDYGKNLGHGLWFGTHQREVSDVSMMLNSP